MLLLLVLSLLAAILSQSKELTMDEVKQLPAKELRRMVESKGMVCKGCTDRSDYYQMAFDSQQMELAEDVKWNEIIFNAEMRMKPVIGNIYHLYKKDSGKYFMSLFAPNECSWGEKHQGSFRLNYDNRWEIVP